MSRRSTCFCILCAFAAAAIALLALAATPSTGRADDAPVSFIRDVAPIIKENCLACHDSRKRSGKYDMSTFEKLMTGGTNGEAIVPGKLAESDFHTVIVATDDRRMPPKDKGDAVPAARVAVLAKWIAQGAKLDAGIDPKADLVRELRLRWTPPVPPKSYRFPVPVTALTFTPDGDSVVVSGHHELTIWNAKDGKLQKRVRTRAERTYAMAFLKNGLLAVAGGRPGQEGDVRLYDLSAKAKETADGVAFLDGVNDKAVLVQSLFETDDSILCLAISGDGKKLAAGGTDRTVRVWDISEAPGKVKLEQTIENHADWVLNVVFSADGKKLFTAGRDKTAKVWDLVAKESVQTFPDHQAIVYGIAVKPDGSTGYSVGADKQLRMWKIGSDGKQLRAAPGHSDEVFKISFAPDSKLLATVSADKSVRLWDPEKLTTSKTLSGLKDYIYALAFSPNGKHLAAGGYDGEVRIWNVTDGKPAASFVASPGK